MPDNFLILNQEHGRYLVGENLRAAGFIPLPPLWVRPDDIRAIKEIAHQYADEVNGIRALVRDHNALLQKAVKELPTKIAADPKTDVDAAWEAYEQSRKSA